LEVDSVLGTFKVMSLGDDNLRHQLVLSIWGFTR